jgi:hypothetical protein
MGPTAGFSAAAFVGEPDPDETHPPTPEPAPRPTPSTSDVDEWRGYDVGAAPEAPPADPVETNVDESIVAGAHTEGPNAPPTERDRTEASEEPRAVAPDEVTDAVDAVLGPAGGSSLDPYASAESGAAPEETPATPPSPEATPREWAEAAGANETPARPDEAPSPDPDDPEAGRWSLSRFTRGLSNF